MKELENLFANNRQWYNNIKRRDPEFFQKLSKQQAPEYLWIGCSDSRVPANEIVGLLPGELFVHRNVANLVIKTDLNCLSVIQFAVDVLKIKHIIVCGHYGCGGVQAALDDKALGLVDKWIDPIKDLVRIHQKKLESTQNNKEQLDLLCELNIIKQVANTCDLDIIKTAWQRGQELTIHGWIYSIEDGALKDLHVCCDGQ